MHAAGGEAVVELVLGVVGLLVVAALTYTLSKRLRFPFTVALVLVGILLAWLAQVGNRALDTLEQQLQTTDFLTGDQPTIADIAVYCYARLAEEAEFDMGTRGAVVAWRERMEALPGWAPPADLLG